MSTMQINMQKLFYDQQVISTDHEIFLLKDEVKYQDEIAPKLQELEELRSKVRPKYCSYVFKKDNAGNKTGSVCGKPTVHGYTECRTHHREVVRSPESKENKRKKNVERSKRQRDNKIKQVRDEKTNYPLLKEFIENEILSNFEGKSYFKTMVKEAIEIVIDYIKDRSVNDKIDAYTIIIAISPLPIYIDIAYDKMGKMSHQLRKAMNELDLIEEFEKIYKKELKDIARN